MIEIWTIGLDLDAFMDRGGQLVQIGMPRTPAEFASFLRWIENVPEQVSRPRLARLARFCSMLSDTRCFTEGDLRRIWASTAAGVQ
jgi:hypothetical protein